MNKVAVVVAAALLVCGLSGYAIAQSASSGPAAIKACAKKKGGALRLASRCRAGERKVSLARPTTTPTVTGPQGPAGPAGQNGAQGTPGKDGTNGTDGTSGTNGTSTGETFYASAGAASAFGGGGACDTTPSGPSVTINAPAGSYVQVAASVTMQRSGATSNAVCLNVDGTNVASTGLASTSLAADTRYLLRGDTSGTTDKFAEAPLVFPVSAGSHTISLRYTSTGGASQFSNRQLWVTLLHPTT